MENKLLVARGQGWGERAPWEVDEYDYKEGYNVLYFDYGGGYMDLHT